jgi:microcystin degradation protein MlrC
MATRDLEATMEVLRRAGGSGRPVVVADIWDNPGGGVAGDNTVLLDAMLKAGIGPIAVAAIWDPQAAAIAHAAGTGAILDMRIGGKTSVASGPPLDLRVEVRALAAPGWQSFRGSRVTLGTAAVVRPVGTEADILLISNRTQTFEPDILTNLGVDPATKRAIVVKSTNHFHAGFAPIAAQVVYCEIPGIYPSDPRTTPYHNLTRPIWPRVEDPFGPSGA